MHGAIEHVPSPVVEWMMKMAPRCIVHRVEVEFARRAEARQPPSIIGGDDLRPYRCSTRCRFPTAAS